jgi:hypothetical protein
MVFGMAVIQLRPNDDRGFEILEELERQTKIRSSERLDDKTRSYLLDVEDADEYAWDPMLDKIDPDWRDHVTNWGGYIR